MHFKRLQQLRYEQGLTQEQVAKVLLCHREVYRRYEKGYRELPTSFAIVLAKYYNVTVDYLLGVSDIRRW